MTSDVATPPGPRPGRPPARRRGLLVRLLLWIAVLVLTVAFGLAGLVAWMWLRADVSTVGKLGFANQLRIPPLLEPRTDASGRKVFDLRCRPAAASCCPAGTPRPGAPTAPTSARPCAPPAATT
jgi:hypothetical protein